MNTVKKVERRVHLKAKVLEADIFRLNSDLNVDVNHVDDGTTTMVITDGEELLAIKFNSEALVEAVTP